MHTISLKLPDDLLLQLESAARARRVTSYDLSRDLAGTVKRLPVDLADNPKYMDGFGEPGLSSSGNDGVRRS